MPDIQDLAADLHSWLGRLNELGIAIAWPPAIAALLVTAVFVAWARTWLSVLAVLLLLPVILLCIPQAGSPMQDYVPVLSAVAAASLIAASSAVDKRRRQMLASMRFELQGIHNDMRTFLEAVDRRSLAADEAQMKNRSGATGADEGGH